MPDNTEALKIKALELANHALPAEPAAIVARAAAYHAFLSGVIPAPKTQAQPGGAAQGNKAPTGGAAAPKTSAGAAAPKTGAGAAAPKTGAAQGNKAQAGPAAGTKAPGGKHSVDEVRDMIRKVATSESLGKQSAADILNDDGGGAVNVQNLKPEFYDAVFEACQVLLNNEGGAGEGGAAPEDDLM